MNFQKSHRILVIAGITAFLVFVLLFVFGIPNMVILSKNPIKNNLSEEDISIIKSQLPISFPDNIKFISIQYMSAWSDDGVYIRFSIPNNELNEFLSGIEDDYRKEEHPSLYDRETAGAIASYQSSKRMFTTLYQFPEKDGEYTFLLNYYRPSGGLVNMFKEWPTL